MAQPYEIYTPRPSSQGISRRPIVLARLPHIGNDAQTASSASASQPVSSLDAQPPAGSHFFIDQRHVTDAPPELTASATSAENQPTSQQYRYHHGPHRQHKSLKSTTTARQTGVAAGLFRLHGELASYSGLIVTLVLAASAVLMYLTVVVPNQTPSADYNNSFESYGSASLEIPEFGVEAGAPVASQIASTGVQVDSFDTSSPEALADPETSAAGESTVPSEASTESGFTWEDAIHAAQEEPANELSANTTESAPELIPAAEQQIESSEEPVLPLNDASAAAYPTTEHRFLDFTKLGVTGVSDDQQSATTEPAVSEPAIMEPAMAQRPEVPTPLPVNR